MNSTIKSTEVKFTSYEVSGDDIFVLGLNRSTIESICTIIDAKKNDGPNFFMSQTSLKKHENEIGELIYSENIVNLIYRHIVGIQYLPKNYNHLIKHKFCKKTEDNLSIIFVPESQICDMEFCVANRYIESYYDEAAFQLDIITEIFAININDYKVLEKADIFIHVKMNRSPIILIP